jgi:hypothetical protein
MPFYTTYTVLGGLGIIIQTGLLIGTLPAFLQAAHLAPKLSFAEFPIHSIVLLTKPDG